MKTLRFILILCVGFLSSCEDAIDIEQVGRITPDVAFQSLQDLRDGLSGVYIAYDGTPDIALSAVFTDEVSIGIESGGQGLVDYTFQLDATSTSADVFWANGYFEINRVNRLIAGAEFVTPETDEQEEYDNILGQVYALRAYSHFKLLSYYSPDLTDDNALGVIAVDFVPGIDQQLLRNTNAEVFALIESDLNTAENLLSTQSSTTFVSQDFITALRARIATYRGQYTAAASYANQLLTSYPIADRGQYVSMFLDTNNTEIIFKFERAVGDAYDGQGATGSIAAGGWAGARFAFTNATIDGGPYFEMGRSLFNLLDPSDIRFNVNIAPSSIISPDYQNAADFANEDVLVIRKYPGSDNQPLMNDLKIFRSSEMLLILAEASADAGNINGASNSTASYIKQLRDARFGSDQTLPVYANQTEAFAAVLNERRIELAFEGHRYLDLKRLGERAGQGVLKDPLDCAFNGACTLPATDHRFTLPIPLRELNANPGLRAQQNPGY
ncbi:RagB/SusD family nutrient uptake outer membrane protein [Aquimarina sp. 2201CG5-10]|uniref:RagB/SusD family nutrient uptake outer membrane protein n=1 Tax=Aquimarina callyspongiae TaxID=3098150 RepID=UPI002AB3975E|nr:RagB/SusD family nutrient uptake outer membrane protein [Aquimarina sp. 2201CG5-10]MDY8134141.1 RagB/SusD family nutrient uptake outer membrane protein [Aquimarina sp. 2201CG5-10]